MLVLLIYANLGLSLEPLIGAVAAGNVAILKPSELSPASSSLLSTLTTYLDNKAIKVIQGGPEETQQLLEQRWDKIFFTGDINVSYLGDSIFWSKLILLKIFSSNRYYIRY